MGRDPSISFGSMIESEILYQYLMDVQYSPQIIESNVPSGESLICPWYHAGWSVAISSMFMFLSCSGQGVSLIM